MSASDCYSLEREYQMDIFIQKYITEGCDEVKCHPTSAHAELIHVAAESLLGSSGQVPQRLTAQLLTSSVCPLLLSE